MGYMSYVTDDRNRQYFRIYIGQSETGPRRIADHSEAIRSSHHDTLHYYIPYVGLGNRTVNFLHLWSLLDSDEDQSWNRFRQNALEYFFCFIFQTLPWKTFVCHFPSCKYSPFSHLGLNVLSPLHQGTDASAQVRINARNNLKDSDDPEIKGWVDFRKKMGDTTHGICHRPSSTFPIQEVTGSDVNTATSGLRGIWRPSLEPLSLCNEEKLYSSLLSCIQSDTISQADVLLPFGTIKARVGFIIDSSAGFLQDPQDVLDENETTFPPWGIRESGFNETNVLVTTYDFQPLRRLSLDELHGDIPYIPEVQSHRLGKLISSSCCQVILV